MMLAAVPPYQIEYRFEAGLSEESQDIWAKLEEIRRKGREPISFSWRESLRDEIEAVLRTHSQPGWDGYEAEPVSLKSANGALRIINALPDHITPPSVIPEPDGEVALEWSGNNRRDFSMSLSDATLTYAGVFGGSCKNLGRSPSSVRYLRRFSEFLLSTFLRLDWVPRAVAPDERTSRYIFDRKHFDEARRSVKWAAFMPSKKTGDISVYRTAHCVEWRVWALGKYFVARRRPDNVVLLARGDVVARAFVQQGLSIVAKPKPHPRHATVANWPSSPWCKSY